MSRTLEADIHRLSRGELNNLIDALTYLNYKYNRQRSPDIAPEQWARIYKDADMLEARYQQEIANG